MYKYIALYVKTCQSCQCQKSNRNQPGVEMGIIEAYEPMELILIDIWGKVHTSAAGNKYILTVVDSFTKFVRAIPLADKTAASIARVLRTQIFAVFGVPQRIHSDK